MPALVAQVGLGAAAGMAFHPVASIAGVVLAGALAGSGRATRGRIAVAALVLLAAWGAGDGALVWQTVRAEEAPLWAFLVAWTLVGIAAGYLLPALVGRAVGTRVTRGTGWLSAIAVGVTVSVALGSIGGSGLVGILGS